MKLPGDQRPTSSLMVQRRVAGVLVEVTLRSLGGLDQPDGPLVVDCRRGPRPAQRR